MAVKKPVVVSTDMGLEWVGVTVGVNGFIVTHETGSEDSGANFVFKSWNELQRWLFDNLAKPPESEVD
jgi:hypothetical protein